MTGSRPARIWGLVAGQAASRGGRVSAGDACAAAVAAVDRLGAAGTRAAADTALAQVQALPAQGQSRVRTVFSNS